MPPATSEAQGSCVLPMRRTFCPACSSLQAERQPASPAPTTMYLLLAMMSAFVESFAVNLIRRIQNYFSGIREHRLPAESTRAQRGRFGEDVAADYCRRKLGYRVIVRNWFHGKDEIDLICRDGETLVFIEVRARSEDALVSGYHSVDRHKKKILRRVCGQYLKQLEIPPKHFRFDIIDVSICKNGEGDVRHYSNVPLFNKHFSVQFTVL